MKKIGILCATAKEVNPYLSTIEIKKASEYAMHCFCNGLIAGTEVIAVYSGCGKINASITAQLLIDRYQVDAVIFSGIAGGMKEELEVFDTVVCTASVFHDTDNEIYTDFPIMDEPIFYADEHLVSLARKAAEGMERKIYFGLATTGDRYVEPIHPDALCIDMETAAAAHTCYLNKVPFVAIRSISDNNKEPGQEAINRNYEKAAYQSYQFVYAMLHKLGKENVCAAGEGGK
jgi:5''-methylthioadenosine/S-adenosylhomocysteine nucleosidase